MGFLALIPTKDWVYAGVIIALLIGFGVYTVHERKLGTEHEVAALKESSDKLQKDTAKQTAELQARATMAEQAYDKEHLAIANRPSVAPVRLCVAADSRPLVPKAGATVAGNAATSASTASLQPVPSGDPSLRAGTAGPDISSLLSALGARADQVSATLREFQTRAR